MNVSSNKLRRIAHLTPLQPSPYNQVCDCLQHTVRDTAISNAKLIKNAVMAKLIYKLSLKDVFLDAYNQINHKKCVYLHYDFIF